MLASVGMTTSSTLERLSAPDIHANLALARAVGWPDTENDWQVVHEAALVLGLRSRSEARLLGQGALGLYGEAGTVAKMIVAPDAQRQGIGARILDALLEEAAQRSMRTLGLVATPFGRPLYEQRQFSCSGDVVVLIGNAQWPVSTTPAVPTPALTDIAAAIRCDERLIGCSRATVLRARFKHATATAAISDATLGVRGYAMATMQGAHALLGPVMAETEPEARALTCSVANAMPGAIRIDVPAEQTTFRAWLQSVGLREQGTRTEMVRGAQRSPWQVPQRFALVAQAWG